MGKLYASLYILFKSLIGENGNYVANLLTDILFYFVVFVVIPIIISTILGYIKLLVTAENYHIKRIDGRVGILIESFFQGLLTFFIIILIYISFSFLFDILVNAVESGDDSFAGFIFIIICSALFYAFIFLNKHYFVQIENFLYFQLIARWGIGPLTSNALKSYIRKECGVCKNALNTISLGNAIESTENGFVFKCSQCRNVEAKIPESDFVYSFGTFKTPNINPYWVIRNLSKEIKQDIKKMYREKENLWLSYYPILDFFRSGQSALKNDDFEGQFLDSRGSSDQFNCIPMTCPECNGYTLIKKIEGKSDIEVAKLSSCNSCGISATNMWQFRCAPERINEYKNIQKFLKSP